MNGPVFDSNQYGRELRDAGLSEPVVQAFVASRLEIHGLRIEMNQRFDAVDKRFDAVDRRFEAVDRRFEAVNRRFDEMDGRFALQEKSFDAKLFNLKYELIKWMLGFCFVQLGATFTMIRMMLPA